MRTVTKLVLEAWEAGKCKSVGNTDTDGVSIYLFGNEIAMKDSDGVYIRTCGYNTATTRDRLNGIKGVHVHTQKGVLYLNGKVWQGHKDWTKVQ